MALKSTITAPPVIEGVTQVNSEGDTIIANPVVLVDPQGEFTSITQINDNLGATDSLVATNDIGVWNLNSLIKKINQSFTTLLNRIPTLSNGKIPVEVGSLNVSVSNASLEIANDAGNPIPISDAGGSITVDGLVSISNFPATQVVNTGLTQPLTDVQLRNTPVSVTGTFWQTTQPISAANLPLPSGAATSANQLTGNTSLASIDIKTPALGQALAAASTPVVLPAAQVTALTPPTTVGISGTLPGFTSTPTFNLGTAPNLTFTNTSFIANAGTNLNTSALALESGGNLAGINNKLPNGLTVTATRLLTDGSGVTQPVSISVLPALASGTNTIGAISNTSFAATQSGTWNITNISGTVSLPTGASTSDLQTTANTSLANIDTKIPALGQALASASTPVVLPAAQITALTPPTSVGLTGTLPAFATTPTFNLGTAPNLTFTNTSFIANAGTNLNTSALALESGGNLAGINSKLPSSLGPKTAVNSFPVTLSSDGAFAIAFGAANDAAATSDTANTGLISLFKRFLERTASWGLSITPWFTKSNTYFGTYTIAKNAEAVAYAAGDVYGTRFELISFGAANGSFFLTGVNLVSSLSTLPSGMGLFSLFLFDSEPTLIADNGAFTLASSSITPQGIPLNSLSLITNATNLTSQTSQINELFRRGSSILYGYLVTQSAFTPTNSAASTMAITLKAIEA